MKPFPRWRPVIAEVCRRRRVGWRNIISKSRLPNIVRCRFEIWWQIRTRFGASFLEIGKRTGGFHHTSVMYGVGQWQERVAAGGRR